MDCFAYVTLESIRRYMLAERFFVGFTPNEANIWSFDYGASASRITSPHGNQLFHVGSTLIVQATVINAATATLRIDGRATETKTIPIGDQTVEFAGVGIIAAGNPVISVEVQSRNGDVRALDPVSIRVTSPGVSIISPHNGDTYNMGDVLAVQAQIHGASSAELTIGEHRQEITGLREWDIVDFAPHNLTVDDVGELDIAVSVRNPYGITASDALQLHVQHKGFKMQERRNRHGDTVRILTYETNPARERVELYFGDSHPQGRNRLETLPTVVNRTNPKVAINAGFFPLNPSDKSIGWAYSEVHGKYEGDGINGRPDRYRPVPRAIYGDGYNYFHSLFYYKDGSSEVIRTMALTRQQVLDKSANAVFIVSGTHNRTGDATGTAPRSMIGVKEDGSIIFLAADSGQVNSSGQAERDGIDVPQGASILREMGAVNVLNLDGGASTQFFYNGVMRTDPAWPGPAFRPVGSVLKVYDT